MSNIPTNTMSVLLVCPPGLEQISLSTSIEAMVGVVVTGKAPNVEAAFEIAQGSKPDILVVNARFFQSGLARLLERFNLLFPEIVRVVLSVSTMKDQRRLNSGAHYILDYSNFYDDFLSVVQHAEVQKDQNNHFN